MSCRRLLHVMCAGLRLAGSSARSMRPVSRRTRSGMTWSTLSAPGRPHNQHRSDTASTCARSLRHGRPRLPAPAGVAMAHESQPLVQQVIYPPVPHSVTGRVGEGRPRQCLVDLVDADRGVGHGRIWPRARAHGHDTSNAKARCREATGLWAYCAAVIMRAVCRHCQIPMTRPSRRSSVSPQVSPHLLHVTDMPP